MLPGIHTQTGARAAGFHAWAVLPIGAFARHWVRPPLSAAAGPQVAIRFVPGLGVCLVWSSLSVTETRCVPPYPRRGPSAA